MTHAYVGVNGKVAFLAGEEFYETAFASAPPTVSAFGGRVSAVLLRIRVRRIPLRELWECQQEGDKILVVAALDGDHQFEHLIHCCIVRDAMYVDVRGSTSRFENLLEGFEDECLDDYANHFLYGTLEHFRSDMNKLGIKT